ncbi:MAG: hypothetical protein AAFZ15_28870 [Bacteroidota bacterium]
MASENEAYKNGCLDVLKKFSLSNNKNKQWAAIAAYKQIGLLNLEYAIHQIGDIIDSKYGHKVERAEKLKKNLKNELFRTLRFLNKTEFHRLFSNNFNRDVNKLIYSADDIEILVVLQYSITTLCLTVDTIQVLGELTKWMKEAEEPAKVLIGNIFLRPYGIAEELEHYYVSIIDESKEGERQCNAIIQSLMSDPKGVKLFSEFILAIYDSFNYLDINSRYVLIKSILYHLKSWAKSSCAFPKGREVMLELFVELINSPGELGSEIESFINFSEKDFRQDDELRLFSIDVIKIKKAKRKSQLLKAIH